MSEATVKSASIRDALAECINERYKARPEHLWTQYPNYEVFRHEPEGNEKLVDASFELTE